MIILEDLPVEKRMEYLKKSAEEIRIRGTNKSLTYDIKQSNRTTVNGQELLNAASEQVLTFESSYKSKRNCR